MELISRKLIEIGVDVPEVLNRLGGNETLYLSICSKFVKDDNYMEFCKAIKKKDYDKASMKLHTLKGVAANLGFLRMESLCKTIMEDIKERNRVSLSTQILLLAEEYNRILIVLKEFHY